METLALSKQSIDFLRNQDEMYKAGRLWPTYYFESRRELAILSRLAVVDQETSDALDARLAKQEKLAKRIWAASKLLFTGVVFAFFTTSIYSGGSLENLPFSILAVLILTAVFFVVFSSIIDCIGIRERIVKSLRRKRGKEDPSLNRTLWEKSVYNLDRLVNDPINQVRYFVYEIGHELEGLLERYNYLIETERLGQATPVQQKELVESGPVVKQMVDIFEWLVAYYNWLKKGKSIGAHPPIQPSIPINLEEVLNVIRGLTAATAPDEINSALEESADALRANKALQDLQIELGNLPALLTTNSYS